MFNLRRLLQLNLNQITSLRSTVVLRCNGPFCQKKLRIEAAGGLTGGLTDVSRGLIFVGALGRQEERGEPRLLPIRALLLRSRTDLILEINALSL